MMKSKLIAPTEIHRAKTGFHRAVNPATIPPAINMIMRSSNTISGVVYQAYRNDQDRADYYSHYIPSQYSVLCPRKDAMKENRDIHQHRIELINHIILINGGNKNKRLNQECIIECIKVPAAIPELMQLQRGTFH